jgi:hypothetical protein
MMDKSNVRRRNWLSVEELVSSLYAIEYDFDGANARCLAKFITLPSACSIECGTICGTGCKGLCKFAEWINSNLGTKCLATCSRVGCSKLCGLICG